MFVIWPGIVFLAAAITLLDAAIRYTRIEKRQPQPLSAEDRALCAHIVDAGLGKPWICRSAIDRGACPCLPCSLLEKARTQRLAAIKHSA